MTNPVALVALDGSATAEYVLPWVRTFARDAGVHLVLTKVVCDVDVSQELAEAELTAAQHYLDGVRDALGAADLVSEPRAVTCGKNIADGITGAALESHVELIIMATHDRSGVRRLVLGSVASEVIQTSPVNVLVVKAREERAEQHGQHVRRILLTLDGSPRGEKALPVAEHYAGAFGATLDVVQVAPFAATLFAAAPDMYIPENLDDTLEQAASSYLRQVQQRLPKELTSEAHVLRGGAAESILDYAEGMGADLIIMTTHGRTGMARFALGSVADRVLRGGPLPVLLVPARTQDAER